MFVLIKKLSKIKDNIVFKRTPQGRETHSNVYIQMKGRDARIISYTFLLNGDVHRFVLQNSSRFTITTVAIPLLHKDVDVTWVMNK